MVIVFIYKSVICFIAFFAFRSKNKSPRHFQYTTETHEQPRHTPYFQFHHNYRRHPPNQVWSRNVYERPIAQRGGNYIYSCEFWRLNCLRLLFSENNFDRPTQYVNNHFKNDGQKHEEKQRDERFEEIRQEDDAVYAAEWKTEILAATLFGA